MIETNLTEFQLDLDEEVNMFSVNGAKIKHIFDRKDNRVVNTVIIGGKSYSFGNIVYPNLNEVETKRLLKRYAKLSIYKALSAFYNVNLPWGSLTGIRPTKMAYNEQLKGDDFEDFFINTMKVSSEKTLLVKDVIKTQQDIYDINSNGTDFFVFIPFCPSRCKYCSFITADVESAKKHVDAYVDCLIKEIEESSKLIKNLRSIYIGGGTPVSLTDSQLEKILIKLDKINSGVEYTVEAGRPDRITLSNVELLKKHNVTRVCLNPQTFNDKTLKKIGRNHTANDIIEKYKLLKGKFIVNMDLIAGLEGESFEDFKYSIDTAIKLNPENITVHTLCVKRGSTLKESVDYLPATEIEKMITYAETSLKQAGYNPYYIYRQKYMAGNLENVGYCKDNTACIYNVDVMEEITDNVACGAGAVSKRVNGLDEKIDRYGNPKDVITYINKIDKINEDKRIFYGK